LTRREEGERARRKGKGRELEKGGRAKARENGGSAEGRVKIWEARRECGGREGGGNSQALGSKEGAWMKGGRAEMREGRRERHEGSGSGKSWKQR